jgi:hypothetical protein
MENISQKDTLAEYQRKMAHNRRIVAQADAIIKRAKSGGIPNRYLRIGQNRFEELLCPAYHKDIKKLSNFIYKNPMEFMKKNFIVIDGGDIQTRKEAGFAILFRMIACDRYGEYKDCGELVHMLQSIKPTEGDLSRNDVAQNLRDVDVIFISECAGNDFKAYFECGSFFDNILGYRDDYLKPTVISFVDPLPMEFAQSEHVMTDKDRFGRYMCLVSQSDCNKDKRFFRIRVKSNG